MLPASQSVTVVDASAACATIRGPSDFVSHQAFLDRAAASIVYQVVDERTDAVVEQFPDEAMLRRRAYFHTLDLTKSRRRAASPPTARPDPVTRGATAPRTLKNPSLDATIRPGPTGPRRYCS